MTSFAKNPSLAVAVITIACASPASAQSAGLRAEVEALHAAMVAAFKVNPASVAAYYTDDATIAGGGSRYVGREQVDQYWRQVPPGAQWSLEVLEVGGDSLTPWVRGRSVLQSQSGRRMETEYIGLLKRRQDGSLRFYFDMFVSARPAAPAVRKDPDL